MINVKDIKLVIWDLDDTFWQGTITENGEVSLIKSNIELVKLLVDKGIMCSICSKNDYTTVEKKFKDFGLEDVWDCFVFPSINFEPKGQRIKEIIDNMQLRDVNVLFLDDNISNINESRFYCPNIKTLLPEEISGFHNEVLKYEKLDKEHSRLKQYKILEVKNIDKNKVSSNTEFLQASNIIVEIKEDCENEVDRIVELVNRTNQLNFTKIRVEKDDIIELIHNDKYKNGYVSVKDNYGDYGIVGFYSLNKEANNLLHFLFSCRTLGMGIEQYVYQELNYPTLEIVGDVVNKVVPQKTVDWINQIEQTNTIKASEKGGSLSILLKGPCDLQSALPYLSIKKENLKTEFCWFDDDKLSTTDSLSSHNILMAIEKDKDVIDGIYEAAPFLSRQTFTQSIATESYDVIIFSLLIDYRCGLYKNTKTGEVIAISGTPLPFTKNMRKFTDKENWEYYIKEKPLGFNWTEENLTTIQNDWEYLRDITVEDLTDNLAKLMSHTPKTKWIFMIGSDIKPSESLLKENPMIEFLWTKYVEMNPALKDFIKNHPQATYIDLAELVQDNSNYTNSITHFTRDVYYKLANKIVETVELLDCNSRLAKMEENQYKLMLKINTLRKFVSKILKFIFSVGNYKNFQGVSVGKYVRILGFKIKIKGRKK